MAYDHHEVEKKWQGRWAQADLYRTREDAAKEKKFVLDMFPYPSGEGLHVGHPKGYIATDIYARHMRMKGHAVLHPMGWDAFGLPAENFALKHRVHPREAVEKNIANFKAQLAHIGFDYDWSREINTTDPAYYHWTQWIFLKMFENGLAIQSDEPINWCPSCKTGLANEDLNGNLCERCDTLVEKKRLPQWVLKITEYADRMLKDLDLLEWPEHIKEAQRNWIGRSEGAEIDFPLVGRDRTIAVFTTRPDTIFGATYLVVAPEHALFGDGALVTAVTNLDAVKRYIAEAATKTEIERGAEGREKTGVRLEGIAVINPATKEEIPVFVADYVLGSYGTGAIMAVPAHDERDFAFASKRGLPVREVVIPSVVDTVNAPRPDKPTTLRRNVHAIVYDPNRRAYLALRSPEHGWDTVVIGGVEAGESLEEAARREVREETGYTDLLYKKTLGGPVQAAYFAKHKDENRVAVSSALYFELQSDARVALAAEEDVNEIIWVSPEDFIPGKMINSELPYWLERLATTAPPYTGTGILTDSGPFSDRTSEEAKWDIVESVGGRRVTRYKLRDWVFSRQRYWGEPIPIIHCDKCGAVPVPYEDLPVVLPEVESYEPTGTGESPLAAIDSWVNVPCPSCKGPGKRETNTMPQWAGSSWYYLRFMDPHNAEQLCSTEREKFWGPVDVYVGGDHAVRHLIYARFWHKFLYDIEVVSTPEPFKRLEFLGFILAEDGRKMSKRLGNIINPDDVVLAYGADAFRMYEMFMGPFENTVAWSTASIAGTARFIERVWQMQERVKEAPAPGLEIVLNETVRKVGADIEAFKFNTAVSQMMICLNAMEKGGQVGREQWHVYLRLLAPFAPHLCEELWEKGGMTGSIHLAAWPAVDESLLVASTETLTVQVNGKRRGLITLPRGASEKEAVSAARTLPTVVTACAGKEVVRTVYVPGKILNLVV